MARWLAISLLALSGCHATIPDGRFACARDEDCPPLQTCQAGICRSGPGVDAGRDAGGLDAALEDAPAIDAPVTDAARIDAPDARRDGGPDAPRDAGPPIRLRVVNAVGDDQGVALAALDVTIAGVTLPIPFGCVEEFTVYYGAVHLDVVAGTGSAPIDLTVMEDSIAIVGRTPAGALSVTVARDEIPPAGSGEVALRYLNLVRTTATTAPLMATDPRVLTTEAVDYGRWSMDARLPDSIPIAVGIGYVELFIYSRILVTFSLPTVSALVVLTGDADRHPGSPGGPRAIVVPAPGATCDPPILPDAQIVAANLAHDRSGVASRVYVCQQGTIFGESALDSGGITGVATTFAGADVFGLTDVMGQACGSSARILDLSSAFPGVVVPGGRYLLTVSGDVVADALPDWAITLFAEPPGLAPPSAGALAQSGVVYGHLAPVSSGFVLDVENDTTGTLISDNLAVGSSSTGYVPRSDVATVPYRFVRSAMPSLVEAAFAAPMTSPPMNVGGVFVILSDVKPPFTAIAPRLDLVTAPYGRPWELRTLTPRLGG